MPKLPPCNVSDVALAGGTFLAQASLLVIVGIGALLLLKPLDRGDWSRFYVLKRFVVLTVVTLIAVAGSTLPSASGFVGGAKVPTIDGTWMIRLVLVTDIFVLLSLVTHTQGITRSAFTALLVAIPTLALFLRRPIVYEVIIYTALVLIPVLWRSAFYETGHKETAYARAYSFVLSSTLLLNLIVAYLTAIPCEV